MNTRQRLTVLVALVVAVMLTPGTAIAKEAPTLAELTAQAASATEQYTAAQTELETVETRLRAANELLRQIEAELPSTPGEEVEAAMTAMGGAFSPSLAERAEDTAAKMRLRDDLRSEIKTLKAKREDLVAEIDDSRTESETLQVELAEAQQAAAAAEAERVRAAMAPNVRLMVDAGHGGSDPGAVGNGLAEKDLNLQITDKVVAAAQRQGWTVGVTRSGDYFVPLADRPASANAWGATALVSIHSNSMGYAFPGNMTIFRTEGGASLGHQIMEEMAPMTPYDDLGNRADVRGLAVLRGAAMPAVIVEVLSVSNPEEAAQVSNPDMQMAYAEAIVKGVADFHGFPYVPPAAPGQPAAPTEAQQASAETTAVAETATEAPESREKNWLDQLYQMIVG